MFDPIRCNSNFCLCRAKPRGENPLLDRSKSLCTKGNQDVQIRCFSFFFQRCLRWTLRYRWTFNKEPTWRQRALPASRFTVQRKRMTPKVASSSAVFVGRGSWWPFVQEVEGGDGSSLLVPVSVEEIVSAEDRGSACPREAEHGEAAWP